MYNFLLLVAALGSIWLIGHDWIDSFFQKKEELINKTMTFEEGEGE